MQMQNNIEETMRFGISVDEARKQLGIGRNLINNYGTYGKY